MIENIDSNLEAKIYAITQNLHNFMAFVQDELYPFRSTKRQIVGW